MHKNILFDLDGTLVDSRETITSSVYYSLETMGIVPAGRPALESMIGSPLVDIFKQAFGLEGSQVDEAVDHYRTHYARQGQLGTVVYEGVRDMLSVLSQAGHNLYIATVKPTGVAEKVLLDLDLHGHFSGICGSSLDPGRRDKSSIISHALDRFGLDSERSVMIGDRYHDIEGAIQNKLKAIGVTWGYGSRSELIDAGADGIVDSVDQVQAALEGGKEDH